MEQTRQVTFRVFSGPNLLVPFAAAVAEFSIAYAHAIPSDTAERVLSELLPAELLPSWKPDRQELDVPNLTISLVQAFNDWRGPSELPVRNESLSNDRFRICLGYYESDAALTALQLGIELANAVFTRASGAVVNRGRLQALAGRMRSVTHAMQPDSITRALMRVAHRSDVPVYSLAPGAKIWMYGQGARAFRFVESVTEHESFIGVQLVKDKVLTTRIIHRLGFPGAQFGVADNPSLAREIAHKLGYPVAVKPSDRDKGVGITLAVDSDAELDSAFTHAQNSAHNRVVIVERHYQGDHHRLSVFGGKLKRITQIRGAHVIGDGAHTVEELIKAENASRIDAEVAAGFVKRLNIDTDMLSLLAKQGYGLTDRPPAGVKLQLRKTSNIATGGKLRDVTQLAHPDNIVMAEALARNFWLDGAGIDFITPDISKSWREIECAVVEINSPPGITSDFLAERAFKERFPEGTDGRIPCFLVVGDDGALASSIAENLAGSGLIVGRTDGKSTYLGEDQRHLGTANLPIRLMSLLLDPACQAIVVSATAEEIETHGIPHTRYDRILTPPGAAISEAVRSLLEAHAASLIDNATPTDARREIASRLSQHVGSVRLN